MKSLIKTGDAIRIWQPKTAYLPGKWDAPCLVLATGKDWVQVLKLGGNTRTFYDVKMKKLR
jgi:hypothetical protein